MATLVLSAVGTLVGGPLGGAIGALVGRQLDAKIVGTPTREGPRLTELAVSTSSYGQPVPQIHGTMRVGGTIIWATDLQEGRSTSGGKGQPRTTSYSYSTSFAVALSSRPIERIGRIWADGNLLRGAAGDLKTAVMMRLHSGHGDQPPDPLIASAEGGACPAFRGCAYVVFENLDLTDFGNRIPALSFEVFAGHAEVALSGLVQRAIANEPVLPGLAGFALDGGPIADQLAILDTVYPLACDASGAELAFLDAEGQAATLSLPEPVAGWEEGDFGSRSGKRAARRQETSDAPRALRHYDPARDYQPGIQRTVGPTPLSGQQVIEFPGVLAAERAKSLTESASQRARWSRERLAWRMAELDPGIAPGSVVQVPGRPGEWVVTAWEWRERGVELELLRRRPTASRTGGASSGAAGLPADTTATGTVLDYFELPWDGSGNPGERQTWAAAASPGPSRALTLLSVDNGIMTPLTTVSRADANIGTLLGDLPPSPSLRLEPSASLVVEMVAGSSQLSSRSAEALLNGANRLLVGDEVLQFASAHLLSGTTWQLSGLLRGRGGTEIAAMRGHQPGASVALLDDRLVPIHGLAGQLRPPAVLAAMGLADPEPVLAPLRNPGASVTPMSPVHPSFSVDANGTREWRWIRRSRGSWTWPEGVEVPLVEQAEAWLVGAGPVEAPLRAWQEPDARLVLSVSEFLDLQEIAAGSALWVRQIGSHALSPPLLLAQLA